MSENDNQTGGFRPSPVAHEYSLRVREFIDSDVIPLEPVFERWDDDAERAMRATQEKAKAAGVWALGAPKEIGGAGLSFLDYVYVNEQVGRSESAMRALGTHSLQDSLMYLRHGSEEQRQAYIPPIVSGETNACFVMTEPEVAGSDPKLLRTTAVLDGDEWVINGHKWFASWANTADFLTVVCLTEPDAEPHKRFSMIVVPTDSVGYEMVRVVPTMGHATNHCELRFTDVRVPAGNLLGGRGEGFTIAQERLGPGRVYHAMRWLGQAQRALELMIQRAKTREAFGSVLADKGEIQRYIAESAAEIQAARMLTLDAAHAIDRGEQARVEIALIKFYGAQVLQNVVDRAVQVHGALGVSDSPLQDMYRHARYARIYDGPDEVHRMVVSRSLVKDINRAPWRRYAQDHPRTTS